MHRDSVQGVFPTMATLSQQLPHTQKAKAEVLPVYAPLPSVWYGEDSELLEHLLDFAPRRKPRRILDATVNGGRFWQGSKRPVIGVDIDRRHCPTLVADNTA